MKIGPPLPMVLTGNPFLEDPLEAAMLEPHLPTESGQSSDEELVATPLTGSGSEDVYSDETPPVDITGTVDKKLESQIQGLQSQAEPELPAEPEGPAVEAPETPEAAAFDASDGLEPALTSADAQDPHAVDHEPNVSDEHDTNNSNLKPAEPTHISSPDPPTLETVDPGTDKADGTAPDSNTTDSNAAEADTIGCSPNEPVPVEQDANKTDNGSADDQEDVSDNYSLTDFVAILPEWLFEEREEGEGKDEEKGEDDGEEKGGDDGEEKGENDGEEKGGDDGEEKGGDDGEEKGGDDGEEKGEESDEEEPKPQHNPFQHESKGHGVFGPDDDSDNDSNNGSTSGEGDAAAGEKIRKSERVLSPAEREWARQKEQFGQTNDALDTLMSMVGIESVKTAFLGIKAVIDSARARKGVLNRRDLNLVLTGNPGTGKNPQRGMTLQREPAHADQ